MTNEKVPKIGIRRNGNVVEIGLAPPDDDEVTIAGVSPDTALGVVEAILAVIGEITGREYRVEATSEGYRWGIAPTRGEEGK